MTYERRIASGILAEMIKEFKGCTIQSTINDSEYYDSDERVDAINDSEEQVDASNWLINYSKEQVDAINDSKELVDAVINPKSGPSSDPKVGTYTINRNVTQKLLKSQFVPKIIPAAIRPVCQLVPEDPPGIRETLGVRQTVLPKEIVIDRAYSGARIFRTLREVSRTVRDGSIQ